MAPVPKVEVNSKSAFNLGGNKSAATKALESVKEEGKRQLKPYGKRQDSGGMSRSRSATKELELPPDDSLMHAPKFSGPLPPTLAVKDGELLTLKCTVTGDPEPQVVWLKAGQPLSSSDIIDLRYKQGLASLTINEVFPEDEGVYSCKATNSLGTVECKCTLSILPMEQKTQMNGKAGDLIPKVTEHLKSREVQDGTAVTLSCKIGGATKFDVVWLHNNKEIKPSKDFQYLNENNKYTLKIAEIFPEDSGTYTCEAFNNVGETSSTCSVVVVVPGENKKQPAFKTFPTSQTVKEGTPATFTLKLEKEATSVTWKKDGKAIDAASSRYVVEGAKKEHSLQIVTCLPTDVGQYSVQAVGKKGETSAAFCLNLAPEEH